MIENIRSTLLITLSILVVVLLVKRFKRYIRLHHMPIPQHVELGKVEVMYHPPVLRMVLHMPAPEEVLPAMLTENHAPVRSWPPVRLNKGHHVLELPLEQGHDGVYYVEVATSTQRTERRFTIRQE